ncbi:MAG: DNA-3-methyladenine glycosylase 2 family protein [Devosia sp.]
MHHGVATRAALAKRTTMLLKGAMPGAPKPIRTQADVEAAARRLARRDKVLAAILARLPAVPLRLQAAGLAGLLRIVMGQQLSTAVAATLWARTVDTLVPLNAATLLAADEDTLRQAGFSRPKMRTVRAIAQAIEAGLDLEALADAPGEEAHARLLAIKGIGPWTADLYLMFCAGHPDIFPVGDLALRKSVTTAYGLAATPDGPALAEMAKTWAPERSTAARLLWAHYRLPKAGELSALSEGDDQAPGFPL